MGRQEVGRRVSKCTGSGSDDRVLNFSESKPAVIQPLIFVGWDLKGLACFINVLIRFC